MQNSSNIQPTCPTDVRTNALKKCSRIGLALAGSGCACALLLSGLLGTQGHAASRAQEKDIAVKHTTAHVETRTVALAYQSEQKASDSNWDIAWNAATYYGIDPNLFERQINQESGFNPGAVSPAGAQGIAQFMPGTAASMGVNPWDTTSALWGAANLMKQNSNMFGGNYAMALAAYNAGPGAVQSAISAGGNNWFAYLPNETRNYVSVIMGW